MSAKRSSHSDDDDHGKLVPAVFARSVDEAEVYRELLEDHDIPAIVADDDDDAEHVAAGAPELIHGVPIMVPEPMLDEAGEVIAHREDLVPFQSDEEEDPFEEEEDDGLGRDAQIDGEFDDSFDDDEDDLFGDDDDDPDELDDLDDDILP